MVYTYHTRLVYIPDDQRTPGNHSLSTFTLHTCISSVVCNLFITNKLQKPTFCVLSLCWWIHSKSGYRDPPQFISLNGRGSGRLLNLEHATPKSIRTVTNEKKIMNILQLFLSILSQSAKCSTPKDEFLAAKIWRFFYKMHVFHRNTWVKVKSVQDF